MNVENQDAVGQTARKEGLWWLPLVSALCGVLSALLLPARDASWGYDEHKGIVTLGFAGLAIGILCVVNQRRGRVFAAAGILTGAVSSTIGLIWIFSQS